MRQQSRWLGKMQSAMRNYGIRLSIWLSVVTAGLSPLRLRLFFLLLGGIFILYNGWHIVDGLRHVHHNDSVTSFLSANSVRKDTLMHAALESTVVTDSSAFSRYLDSLAKINLLDSVYAARPGLRDSITVLKHFYHIK
jgi:hypothetical protein